MLKKLQQKWQVSGLQLILILFTFAIGGSLCGFAGRKVLDLLNINNKIIWFILYILIITILWPLCVLVISIPFGQFSFFKKYLYKIASRINKKNKKQNIVSIAIFASGNGSNAENLTLSPALRLQEKGVAKNRGKIDANYKAFKVALIVCNKPGAGVLKIAAANNIPALLIEKERFFTGDGYVSELKKYQIDFIVLAGFLWKIPAAIINAYPGKIINIHPALLPKYGGKGMHGTHVHEAVIANKETESGITIHYVDELYDHGEIIFQGKCAVEANDTADSLAQKIHVLEHKHYPGVIESLLQKQNRS